MKLGKLFSSIVDIATLPVSVAADVITLEIIQSKINEIK